jgi:redox-sensitive bicupin YhaK (pirin superfamily)
MLEGEFLHEDFRGHSGSINAGDIQWLSAARGVVHKELPSNRKRNHGVQLWINLSKEYKMAEPTCQEYEKHQLPHISPSPGVNITVLSGTCHGVTSPITSRTPTLWIEVKMEAGSMLEQDIPLEYTAAIYTITGSAKYGDVCMSEPHHLLTMKNNGTSITVESLTNDTHFFIIAAQPLNEPIVQLGPFVSNTKQEIHQAFTDYQNGRNGFEGAPEWISLID